MWAMEVDMNWEFCSYVPYPEIEPLPISAMGIPQSDQRGPR
jgi:hypothetical protein